MLIACADTRSSGNLVIYVPSGLSPEERYKLTYSLEMTRWLMGAWYSLNSGLRPFTLHYRAT